MPAYSGLKSVKVIAFLILWCGCGRSLQHTTTPFGSGGSRGSGGAGGVAGAGAASGPGGVGGVAGAGAANGPGGAVGAIGGNDGGVSQIPGGSGAQGAACKTFNDCQCGLLCTNSGCQIDQAYGEGEPGAACNRECDCLAGLVCLSDPNGSGSVCSRPPKPDSGVAPPQCGDYVDCQGDRVSGQDASCGRGVAAPCPSNSSPDDNGYCHWSVSSSCPLGYFCKVGGSSGGPYCKSLLGDQGAACTTFLDCKCGLVCQNNLCTYSGNGAAGSTCNRACDCGAGLLCAPNGAGNGKLCSPSPRPDGGAVAPKCGDYVDCAGAAVSSGPSACNPNLALSCPSGSSLDIANYCMWSAPSSCPSGQTCKEIVGGSYQCQPLAGRGAPCIEDTDCACGLACPSEACLPVETLTTAGMAGQTTVFCFGSCPDGDYCSIDPLHWAGHAGTCIPLAPRLCPADGGTDASSGTPDGGAGGRGN